MLDTYATDVVGPWVTVSFPRAGVPESVRDDVSTAFDAWALKAGLWEKLKTLVRAKTTDGEAFAIFITDPTIVDETNKVTLNITPIECDRVESWTEAITRENETDGIRFDEYGHPTEYRILKYHPGDYRSIKNIKSRAGEWVKAANVIHYFEVLRPEQVRGVSDFVSALDIPAMQKSYRSSVTTTAINAASVSGVLFTDNVPECFDSNDQSIGRCGMEVKPNTVFNMQRGAFLSMPEGWKITQLQAEQPTTQYADFVRFKKFGLQFYSPGFLLFYPRSECGGNLPKFEEDKAFRDVLREANLWSNTIKINSISQINDKVINGKALELINIAETRHNNQLAEIGLKIAEEIDRIRFIGVAGPSSSGKTTFTNRVRIELLARGIDPVMISMDDFYHCDDKDYPVDENGKLDYEHINALDLKLFDSVIYKLINGDAVALPRFDFKTKKRTFTEPVKLAPKQPVLVEGIHALNDSICPSVPGDQKFKIFIAPLAQYGIDDHTPISLSEMRLIRRIVRDKQFRNVGCEKTLEIWNSVRAGEFKWIYKHQNNADVIFNSDLAYEPLVLAKYAIPVLDEIPKTSPYFVISTRLRRFLKYYESITDNWIPCNSLLREFIGGSIFYTDDKK